MSHTVDPLPVDALRFRVPEDALSFRDTGEIEPSDRIVGQELALRAIRQAVEMDSPGYNLFVVGLESGGRLRTVQRILEGLEPRRRARRDFVYVRNFTDTTRPRLLLLPAGAGPKFARELATMGELLFEEVPRILESEPVRKGRDRLLRDLERSQRDALLTLQAQVRSEGFVIGDQGGDDEVQPVVLFMVEEEPRTRGEVHMLARDGKLGRDVDEVEARFDALEDELAETMVRARGQVLVATREVDEVERVAVGAGVAPLFKDLSRRFPKARQWLAELHQEVADNVELFRGEAAAGPETTLDESGLLAAFRAHVLHRGARGRTAPIVLVADPTYGNLFGGIVSDGQMARPADHTHLRAGALHDADGGYLVINAADIIMEPGAWKTLKRAMLFGKLGIQNLEGATQGAAAPLRPDPVPLDVRVVLLGDNSLYAFLHAADPDFASIFKIKAEFEEFSDYSDDLPAQVAAFLARMCRREGTRHLTRGAVADIVGWAVRQAGRGGRIRLAFGEMADLAREASYLARGQLIERADVEAALAAREERQGRVERLIRDALRRDVIHIATDGAVTGQVNALAVYHTGGHEWGRPLRVTATVGAGRGGIVNIEREAGLAGKVYTKGVQVLSGFVRGRFGRRRTLALTASIAMEQNYGRIDGDSASSAEVYALLSALAGVGVDQGRAVTGSVDQLGNVQPIGGVNVKIEGFFRLCAERGLTGSQGVVIPARNTEDLCLSADVVQACAEGRFHVWPVSTIEQGLALLTGIEVGDPTADEWPAGTVYGRIQAELDALEKVVQRAGKAPNGEKPREPRPPEGAEAAAPRKPARKKKAR